MDTSSIYPHGYFLPTQGIDVATGQRDLQSLFGRPGEAYLVELRTIDVGTTSARAKCCWLTGSGQGRSGFYIRASLDLSRVRNFFPNNRQRPLKLTADIDLQDLIARLEGRTPTPLERLSKIETRRTAPGQS